MRTGAAHPELLPVFADAARVQSMAAGIRLLGYEINDVESDLRWADTRCWR